MKKTLVSVIVPVYNIEKYVDDCISSIVNQTYQNIEVIIIDDGSTDNSGKLIDNWREDKRIKVIHQQNQGLSATRNNAMKVSTGEYLIFVDGDDMIANNMVETMLKALKKSNADCIFCQYEPISANAKEFHSIKEVEEEEAFVVDTEEAQLRLLNHIDIVSVVWNGLYKSELVKDLMFIVGKKNEDVMWRYLAVDRCKRIGYISERLYGYRMREDSLMHQNFSLKDLDNLEGTVRRADYIMNRYENLKDTALTQITADCTIYYIKAKKLLTGNERKQALSIIKDYRKKYPVKFREVMNAKNISKGRKYLVGISCISFPLASYLRFYLIDGGMKNLR